MKYKSIITWPTGAIPGGPYVTEDTHDCLRQAIAVCTLVKRDGLGGEGKLFPVSTRVEEVLELSDCDPFLRAYLTAAFWTFDKDAPPGPYGLTGRARMHFEKLSPSALLEAKSACEEFQADYSTELEAAGTPDQNGQDLWLTRNHHGAGFWDRGYGPIGDRLTEYARRTGERTIYEGDDKKLYFQ